jgi:hypothetical protein
MKFDPYWQMQNVSFWMSRTQIYANVLNQLKSKSLAESEIMDKNFSYLYILFLLSYK